VVNSFFYNFPVKQLIVKGGKLHSFSDQNKSVSKRGINQSEKYKLCKTNFDKNINTKMSGLHLFKQL
jgi:hypothetical protein